MGTDTHKDLVRRFMAALESRGDLDDLDEICEPEVADTWRTAMADFPFTDRTLVVDELVAEDGAVAVHWTINGTHTGEFLSVPATGRRTSNRGAAFVTLVGDRITDVTSYYDAESLLEQLGARVQPTG